MAEPNFDGWTPPSNWRHPHQADLDLERAVKILREQCNLHLGPQDQEIFGKDCTCVFSAEQIAEIAQASEDADAEYTKRINDPRGG